MDAHDAAYVRSAGADDADEIARIQLAAWGQRFAVDVPSERFPDPGAQAELWADLLRSAPSDALTLVAVSAGQVVGALHSVRASDPDLLDVAAAEIVELVVDPDHSAAGHGSRLVNAWADLTREDGVEVGTCWVAASDDALRHLLGSSGFAADGALRTLSMDDGSATIRTVRYVTDL